MPTIFDSGTNESNQKGTPKRGNYFNLEPLSAFARLPAHIHFETQEKQEIVQLFLRQHPIVNVHWLIISVLMILAPIFVFPIVLKHIPLTLPATYLLIGNAFWYLASFGYALANFLYWFFNIYIVTNERLVDIDFLYLLYKRFSQAELTKIQDISFTSGGILATVFNYGNVSIETAGEAPNLVFEKIPHPEKVVETIRSLTEPKIGKHL